MSKLGRNFIRVLVVLLTVLTLLAGFISNQVAIAAKDGKKAKEDTLYGDFSFRIDATPGNCDYNSETGEMVCSGESDNGGLNINYNSTLKMTLPRPFGSPYDYIESFSSLDDKWDFYSQVFSLQFPLGGFFTLTSKQAFSSRIRGRSKGAQLETSEEGEEIYDVGDPEDTSIYRMGTMRLRSGLGGFTLGGTMLLVNLEGAEELTPGIHHGFLLDFRGKTVAGIDMEAKTYFGAVPGGMCVGSCNSEEGYDEAVILPNVKSFQEQTIALSGFEGPYNTTFDVDFRFAKPQSFSLTLSGSKELSWKGWDVNISSSTNLSPSKWEGLGTTEVKLTGNLKPTHYRESDEDIPELPTTIKFTDGNGDLLFEKGNLGIEYSRALGDGQFSMINQFLWNFSDDDFAYRSDLGYSRETWKLQFINIFGGDVFEATWKTNLLRLETGIRKIGLNDLVLSAGFIDDGYRYSINGTWKF